MAIVGSDHHLKHQNQEAEILFVSKSAETGRNKNN